MIGDFNKLFPFFQEVQEKIKQMETELKNESITTEVGAGAIKITMNGAFEVTELLIDPELLSQKEALEDLLISAYNKAREEMSLNVQQKTQQMRSQLLGNLNLPGIDNLFNS